MTGLNYAITLCVDELILDFDDLMGIVMQLEAIAAGWGMDFTVHTIEEKEIINWTETTPSWEQTKKKLLRHYAEQTWGKPQGGYKHESEEAKTKMAGISKKQRDTESST